MLPLFHCGEKTPWSRINRGYIKKKKKSQISHLEITGVDHDHGNIVRQRNPWVGGREVFLNMNIFAISKEQTFSVICTCCSRIKK